MPSSPRSGRPEELGCGRPIPEQQSAALLVLILSQGSGGSTTDVESIARTKLMDYPQQNGRDSAGVFADSGARIGFRRLG